LVTTFTQLPVLPLLQQAQIVVDAVFAVVIEAMSMAASNIQGLKLGGSVG
jgi:hypothetical protein